jgi:hypothetical protein
MAYLNFTDQLAEAKRRAKLSGRPVSQQEVAGISEGQAAGASDRIAKGKVIALQEDQSATQKEQFGQSFEQQKMQNQRQYELAQETLESQIAQYEASSAAQKQQFGAQMVFQIGESAKQAKQWQTALDVQQTQYAKDDEFRVWNANQQVQAARDAGGGGGCCIIVTVASNPTMKYVEGRGRDSYAVNVTRIYRDTYMPPWQLRGYYMVAEALVPRMLKSQKVMDWVKRNIVDHGVPYCEWRIGMHKRPSIRTIIQAKAFLWLCSVVGSTRPEFTRCNGEVF